MRSARILSCIYIILFLVGAGEVRAQGLKPSVAGYVRRAESYIASNAWNSAKREKTRVSRSSRTIRTCATSTAITTTSSAT